MLGQNYRRLGHPTAFGGVNQLVEFYPGLKKSRAAEHLSRVDSYTRQREPKKPRYNPVYVRRKRQLLQADLMDKTPLANYNDGARFWLVVIDTFTRKLWVRRLRRKTAAATAAAFADVLSAAGGRVKRLMTDSGTEFTGRAFQNLLAARGIRHNLPIYHAPHVERVIRSLQTLLGRYTTEGDTLRYEDVVQPAVETYNSRKHRMIGMSPDEAELPENQDRVRLAQEAYYQKFEPVPGRARRRPKFAVGDFVRVRKTKAKFFRSFHETFGVDFYVVTRVLLNLPSVMYKIARPNGGEEMDDRYYEAELQKATDAPFKIRRVHWNRRRRGAAGEEEVLVSWEGMPRTGDSWLQTWRARLMT